jgi:diguanylate cyclase (GGDEF)-like protein
LSATKELGNGSMCAQIIEQQPEFTPNQVEHKIRALEWRDLQLWCIELVALAAVATGLIVLVTPQMSWSAGIPVGHQHILPQLIVGLTVLLVLLNIYLFHQRAVLLATRRQLTLQLQIAERSARTDALTGAFNRRLMEEALKKEVARVQRNMSNLSLMLTDVNGFKDFNTKFGHVIGDQVLVEVTRLLHKNFRAADVVTRYGGDEFLVIMPDTDLGQAEVAVKRLESLLANWNGGKQREYPISLSCGVAEYAQGAAMEDFIKAADADLYVRKARTSTGHLTKSARA